MAYQNTVRGMQCRNIGGNAHAWGTGGYWECNSAMIQLAQLVSRITVNQMEMAEHYYNVQNQLNQSLITIQSNQGILNNQLKILIENQTVLSGQLNTLAGELKSIRETLLGSTEEQEIPTNF